MINQAIVEDVEDKPHYVYAHVHETDIFYIGKGVKVRAFVTVGRSLKWNRYVNKINKDYEVIIFKRFATNDQALKYESKMIDKYNPSCNIQKREGGYVDNPERLIMSKLVQISRKTDKPLRLVYYPGTDRWAIKMGPLCSNRLFLSKSAGAKINSIPILLSTLNKPLDK